MKVWSEDCGSGLSIRWRWPEGWAFPVPSVTTILALPVPVGLLGWQRRCDISTIEKIGGTAANKGITAHRILQDVLLGVRTPRSEAEVWIDAYRSKLGAEIVSVEAPVASPRWLIAGSIDVVAKVNGRLEFWDIKTGKYKWSAFPQLGAYALAYLSGLPEFSYENLHDSIGLRILNTSIKEKKQSDFVCQGDHIASCMGAFLKMYDIWCWVYALEDTEDKPYTQGILKRGIRDASDPSKRYRWPLPEIYRDKYSEFMALCKKS